MGQRQLVGSGSVPRQQQPAGQSLFQAMSSVAGCRLGDLETKAFQIAPKVQAEKGILLDGRCEFRGGYAQGFSLDLHHGLMQAPLGADQEPYAHHAFAADGADFDRITVFQRDDKGHHPRLRKVGVLEATAPLMRLQRVRCIAFGTGR